MKLTRNQKVLAGVAVLGLGVVAIDQLVLLPGPQSAGASEFEPDAAPRGGAARIPLVLTSNAPASSGIREALTRIASDMDLGSGDITGAFETPAVAAATLDPAVTVVLETPDEVTIARLSAIRPTTIVAGANPVAMMKGRSVAVGQTVDGFTLRRVETDAVVVEKDGRSYRLPLAGVASLNGS